LRNGEENQENHFASMTEEENDEDLGGKQSAPSQTTLEELHEEEGVDKEVTQEVINPARVSTPEQPEPNIEEAPQEENQGFAQDNSLDLKK